MCHLISRISLKALSLFDGFVVGKEPWKTGLAEGYFIYIYTCKYFFFSFKSEAINDPLGRKLSLFVFT